MDSRNPKSTPGEPKSGSVSVFAQESVRVAKIAQLLPMQQRDSLCKAACAEQDLFHPPGGAGSAVGSTLYWSMETDGNDSEGGLIGEALEGLGQHILDHLPSIFEALGVEPFPVPKIPFTLIHGLDGHGGTPHVDSIDGRFVISLLYYFQCAPKVFRGGDLELYETDAGSASGHRDQALTKIEHEDNLLLAFESETFHGVTDVHCDSREFADGRFVAVAFLGAP